MCLAVRLALTQDNGAPSAAQSSKTGPLLTICPELVPASRSHSFGAASNRAPAQNSRFAATPTTVVASLSVGQFRLVLVAR